MNIKRRDFLGFFLIGGLVSFLQKKLLPKKDGPRRGFPSEGEVARGEKEAMFWRRKA